MRSKAACLLPRWRGCRSPAFVGTSRVAGSPVLAEVVCRWGRRRLWGRLGFVAWLLRENAVGWLGRHIEALVPVCGSFATGPGIGLFARKFSASRFEKGDDMRGKGAPEIKTVILITIPPEDGRHTVKNRAAGFAGR